MGTKIEILYQRLSRLRISKIIPSEAAYVLGKIERASSTSNELFLYLDEK